MSNQDEDYERLFQAEMEKAIALSLQDVQINKMKQDGRQRSVDVIYRPRPLATVPPINRPSLPPPPSSSRKHSTSSAHVQDLMSFHSPTKVEDTANRNAIAVDSQWEFIQKTELRPSPISLEYGFRREVLPRNAPSLKPAESQLTDILRVIAKKDNSNLIDLSPNRSAVIDEHSSVLDVFDPFAPVQMDNTESESGYDPFGYMSPASTDSSAGEPIYTESEPLEQNVENYTTVDTARKGLVFDSSRVVKTALTKSPKIAVERMESWQERKQLTAFCEMVTKLRSEFVYSDKCTNAGLVLAATVDCDYRQQLSVKLVVIAPDSKRSVPFTCDLTSTVEHVISHVVYALEAELNNTSANDYVLKVAGLAEYLAGTSKIGDYEYVYQCVKLDQDVLLNLIPSERLNRTLARTSRDDANDIPVLPQQLMLSDVVQPISHDTLTILLDTLDREMERMVSSARQLSSPSSGFMPRFSYTGVEQAIKAICSVMGELATVDITNALTELRQIFQFMPHRDIEVVEDCNNAYSTVAVGYRYYEEQVEKCCDLIRQAVYTLIKSYCNAFKVDFRLCDSQEWDNAENVKSLLESNDSVLTRIHALHRPDPSWNFLSYIVEVQVYHGTVPLRSPQRTNKAVPEKSLFLRVTFDFYISFDDIVIASLPRESRLVFVVHGLRPLPPDHEAVKKNPDLQFECVELGWSAIQCFDHEGFLTQGRYLLSVWPGAADKRVGPAPEPGSHPIAGHPVLEVTLPDLPNRYRFPAKSELIYEPRADEFPEMSSLNPTLQEWLTDTAFQDTYQIPKLAEKDVFWRHRNYLTNIPEALPKVLLFAPDWSAQSLPHLYSLISRWAKMSPLTAIQLLLPCFPDSTVRAYGVSLLRELSCDELVDYLPQLVEALKFETYDNNQLAKFLLEMSLMSPRVAHFLFWHLVQILPGDSPQNRSDVVDKDVAGFLYHWRLRILLRALLSISGEAMRQRFLSQQCLVKELFEIAQALKHCKESIRIPTLHSQLEVLHHTLQDKPSALPLSASVSVVGVKVRNCSYFPSKTLPLKIYFMTEEAKLLYPAIFKVGDDLQQDSLTLQMIRVMDKLWLKEGLDLKMVTFSCIPTGRMRGMIQLVEDAETLRKIQTEHGLTGSFKDRPINEWLAKHNPGALEYERAVKNFTASCAGYCVATYVLGICDRHNDNIMLKTTGHLFHIDFGKFLGDAQMFGNFKRDRTPFVLTPDMAYVINGGDRPSLRFQQFVDLCLQAFAIARANKNVILNLLGFMVSAGIPGVRLESVRYVQDALLPNKTKVQAAETFSKLIESALKSWFTQFNFFLHNLSQIRATSDREGGDLLSFVPKRYRCEDEGRITAAQVHNVQKRYDSEKYHVYVIRVEREGHIEASYVFRTYREFCELDQKICAMFPLAKIYNLPVGMQFGRQAVSQVAERRKIDIEKFLVSLFSMADEVAHSDIVYTFFHPLLRDQEEANVDSKKLKATRNVERRGSEVTGQLKLTMNYQRGMFTVMVEHARGLAKVAGGQEPSTFVKVYLLPDRSTKRKTKVVRKNSNPTFMETLVYQLPLEEIKNKILRATVWSYDPLQDNEFLGGIEHPLMQIGTNIEISEWFSLSVTPRYHGLNFGSTQSNLST